MLKKSQRSILDQFIRGYILAFNYTIPASVSSYLT